MPQLYPYQFLAMDDDVTYEAARFAVLPIPYDATTSYGSGARHGPAAIIAASAQVEDFDEELQAEYHRHGIVTLAPLEPRADGPEAMHQAIFEAAQEIVRDDKFLFGLGGDHSVTSALVRAVMTRYQQLSVLQIDAHGDLRDAYQGTKFSHACVMRRVHEYGAAIVPVGLRSVSRQDHEFILQAHIEPITSLDCVDDEDWPGHVLDTLGEHVYVTIDIDGFDPAYAPGTGTPEPGGLDWFQVTGLLRLVSEYKTIVGADIVEVAPISGQTVTEFLAARLAYKLMCYVAHKWENPQPDHEPDAD